MNAFANAALGLSTEDGEEHIVDPAVCEQVETALEAVEDVAPLAEEETALDQAAEAVDGLADASQALCELHDQLVTDLEADKVLTVESARYVHTHASYIVDHHRELIPAISLSQEDYQGDNAKRAHQLATEDLARKDHSLFKGIYVSVKNLLARLVDFFINLFSSRKKLISELESTASAIKALPEADQKKSGINIDAFLTAMAGTEVILKMNDKTVEHVKKLRKLIDGVDWEGFNKMETGKDAAILQRFLTWLTKKAVNGVLIALSRGLVSLTFRNAASFVRIGKAIVAGKENPVSDYHFDQVGGGAEAKGKDFGVLAKAQIDMLRNMIGMFNSVFPAAEPLIASAFSKTTFEKINKLEGPAKEQAVAEWKKDLEAKLKPISDSKGVKENFPEVASTLNNLTA